MNRFATRSMILFSLAAFAQGCAHVDTYHDSEMDFGSIRTVAVMPFLNLSKDSQAGERVRDVFCTMLLATGAIYVLPTGEVVRGVVNIGIPNPATPTPEEAVKLAKAIKADAIIQGVIREYGEVRSGNAISDMISLSIQIMEAQTGKVIWSASSTQGGITFMDRLLGGGGRPLNNVTQKAIDDIINKLFE